VNPKQPAPRWLPVATLWSVLMALSGCAGAVRSVSVATSQADTPAYQLSGPSLAHLRAEAARRCPQGFQVLRWAESGERRGAPDAGMVSRWLTRGVDAVAPPEQSAQMMVLCQPAAGSDRVAGRETAGAADQPARMPGGSADKAPASSTPAAPAKPPLPALVGIDLPPPSQAPVSGYQ